LGALRAQTLPARDLDPRAAAQDLGKAARLRSRTARGTARLMDLARRRDGAGGAALHQPLPQWRGRFCRRSRRTAEPRLSEALGGADSARVPPRAMRDIWAAV